MVEHSHRGFDVVGEEFDVIRGEGSSIKNNTPNGGMLNTKQTENNPKQSAFWSFFFLENKSFILLEMRVLQSRITHQMEVC